MSIHCSTYVFTPSLDVRLPALARLAQVVAQGDNTNSMAAGPALPVRTVVLCGAYACVCIRREKERKRKREIEKERERNQERNLVRE